MLKSRRGLLSAGLAVAVTGALGVAWTMTAGAEQITGGPARPVAAAAPAGEDAFTPPSTLPWGEHPEDIRKGRPGQNAKSLRAEGLDAAAADTSGSQQPRGRYGPKGRSGKGGNNTLRSERTTIAPPEPPPGPLATSASASPSASATPTEEPTTAATSEPAPQQTTDAPAPEQSTTSAAAPKAATGTTAAAPEPSSTVKAAASTVNYFYGVGNQLAETDGFHANVTIAKPYLDKADYHSLAELAVQSADGKQIVEVGWNVDRVVNGDDDPHLFVYHWVNREESCYNGCGFVQYSKNIKPGDTLTYDVAKRFGIQYFNGAWWVAFDTEWVGYFPEKLWNDAGVKFSRSGLVQVFGEVAAASTKPCTDMGNGQTADKTTAASMGSVTYLNGPAVTLAPYSTSTYYTVSALSLRTFRYGGPGAC